MVKTDIPMKNPLAPPGVQGIQVTPGFNYEDVAFNYTYEQTVLSGATLNGEIVQIYPDADFIWRGFVWRVVGDVGPFLIQLQDGEGNYISSGLIDNRTLACTPGDPFPVFPEVKYYAGGRIFFNIQNPNVSDIDVRLLFMGVSRYRK